MPTLTTSEAIEIDEYVSNEIPDVETVHDAVEVAVDDRSLDEVKSDEQNEDLSGFVLSIT